MDKREKRRGVIVFLLISSVALVLVLFFQNCGKPMHTTTEPSVSSLDFKNSFAWVTGANWSSCTKTCGGGSQTRQVSCMGNDGTPAPSPSSCTDPKPATTQSCNTQACPSYKWVEGGVWSSCSASCTQTQGVTCQDNTGAIVADSFCTGTKPSTSRSCNIQACPTSCTFNGQTIANGSSVTVYTTSSVPYGQTCPTQIRKCTNGVLSGTATYASCTVENSIVCGADVVNTTNDAISSLQSCIMNTTASVIELKPGRYYIASTLTLSGKSNVTIQTQGVTSGPACLSSGAAPCAILTATGNNQSQTVFASDNNKNFNLNYIAIDGNKTLRKFYDKATHYQGYNALVHGCGNCIFKGFASVNGLGNSGMGLTGNGVEFDTVLFRDNGFGVESMFTEVNTAGATVYNTNGSWSDGLTVNFCDNLKIHDSYFIDNSDIDLIIGGAKNSLIYNNTIGNSHNFAYGALMLDNFGACAPGDFTGTTVYSNKINCGNQMCGFGINVGPYFWYTTKLNCATGERTTIPNPPILNGTVTNNWVTGAIQGIVAYGSSGATITKNIVYSPNYNPTYSPNTAADYPYAYPSFNPDYNVTAYPTKIATEVYSNTFLLSGNKITGLITGSAIANPFSTTADENYISLSGNNPSNTQNQLIPIPGVTSFPKFEIYQLDADKRVLNSFRSFVGRNPTSEEIAYWSKQFNIKSGILNLKEVTDIITRLYVLVYGTNPTSTDITNWKNDLNSGGQIQQMKYKMVYQHILNDTNSGKQKPYYDF